MDRYTDLASCATWQGVEETRVVTDHESKAGVIVYSVGLEFRGSNWYKIEEGRSPPWNNLEI